MVHKSRKLDIQYKWFLFFSFFSIMFCSNFSICIEILKVSYGSLSFSFLEIKIIGTCLIILNFMKFLSETVIIELELEDPLVISSQIILLHRLKVAIVITSPSEKYFLKMSLSDFGQIYFCVSICYFGIKFVKSNDNFNIYAKSLLFFTHW